MGHSVSILYEDDDVLVINKPAGLVVHEDGRTSEPTVADWLLAHRPEVKGVGDQIHDSPAPERSGIVHRLDRETSGAMVLAKTQRAFDALKKQFQKDSVRKVYHAFVYGRVRSNEGVIDRPIARSRRNPALWSATRGRRGREREAVTEYRVMARFAVPVAAPPPEGGGAAEEQFSFLELRPRTGRTHQIRVHLKAINYPAVCDKLYAPKRECALGFSRLALHARSISFTLTSSGERVAVEAPYPQDFERALSLVRGGGRCL